MPSRLARLNVMDINSRHEFSFSKAHLAQWVLLQLPEPKGLPPFRVEHPHVVPRVCHQPSFGLMRKNFRPTGDFTSSSPSRSTISINAHSTAVGLSVPNLTPKYFISFAFILFVILFASYYNLFILPFCAEGFEWHILLKPDARLFAPFGNALALYLFLLLLFFQFLPFALLEHIHRCLMVAFVCV